MSRTVVMYALFTNRKGTFIPYGIFPSRWKAKDAQNLWNSSSGWQIRRMAITISDDLVYEMYAHAYKKLTPSQLHQVTIAASTGLSN